MLDGFVYILGNPAWPDALKIGQAVDVESRLSQYQTYDPLRQYRLVDSLYTPQRSTLEHALHRRFEEYRINGEWFRVPASQARAALREEAARLATPTKH